MPSGRWKVIRQRFGIAAPRVEVQTQIPWYWRWAGIARLREGHHSILPPFLQGHDKF